MTETILDGLARILLPKRMKQGILVMLEFFYDDSGTHEGSDVVVWGGVAGHTQFITEMQTAWDAQLLSPCDGKPPISKFSSHDLFHAIGEFEGYNQGAKDLTRRNFRQVIVNAGLSVLSYGISAVDWNDLISGGGRVALKSPEHTILALAIQGACETGIVENMPVAFVFDAGCAERVDIPIAFKNGVEAAEIDKNRVSYGVSPVLGNAGLQAADLVAHETYQLFCEYRLSGEASPKIHLDRLREGAHDFQARWIGRGEIEHMVEMTKDMFNQLGGQ